MNPNITPDNKYTATRPHHRVKNSHYYYCILSFSSTCQRSTKTCASLTTKKNDRHHHGSNTPIRRGDSGVEQAAHDLRIPVGQRSNDAGSTVPTLGSSDRVVQRFTGRFNYLV
ncbi:unnamed protein product [Ectocarpus sp. 4 AP-2014]